jgi:hypothetical protein
MTKPRRRRRVWIACCRTPRTGGCRRTDVISTILLQLPGERSPVPQCSPKPNRIRAIFQWLTKNDVCEFESSQPSHGVGLWEPRVWISGSQKWPPVLVLRDCVGAERRRRRGAERAEFRAASAISSMLAPSNPRSRKTLRAASRMRSSTSPARSLGGRPRRRHPRAAPDAPGAYDPKGSELLLGNRCS